MSGLAYELTNDGSRLLFSEEYVAFFYILHVSTDMYKQKLQNKSFELILQHIPALDMFMSGALHENDIQDMCTCLSY